MPGSSGRKPETFNWALDWFDAELARGELANAPALRITGAGAAELTFAELSERSNRVANGLRAMGVRAATACCSCSATSRRSGR